MRGASQKFGVVIPGWLWRPFMVAFRLQAMSESEQVTAGVFAEGSVIADRYRVVRQLGEGAMGAVYVVEHVITRHKRALKTLHASMCASSAIVARFLNEASAAGHIGNPHIVETIDAGRLEDGSPYLVMELLHGRPLDDLLEKRGLLEPVEAAEIVAQACAGMHAAHEKGVVHRDLKPANLFIVSGSIPFVKILDFGISRFEQTGTPGQRLTQTGQLIGTPYYMAPEQARTAPDIDERSDVYALGVVLYECLTGKVPFAGDSYLELLTNIVNGEHDPVEKLQPEVPAPLCAIVKQAMSLERRDRFASAFAMEQALRSLPLAGMSRVDPSLVMARLSGYPSSCPPDAPFDAKETVLSVSIPPPTAASAPPTAASAPPTAASTALAQTDFAATDSPMSRSVPPEIAAPQLPAAAKARSMRVLWMAAGLLLIASIIGLAARLSHKGVPPSAVSSSSSLPVSVSPSQMSPPTAPGNGSAAAAANKPEPDMKATSNAGFDGARTPVAASTVAHPALQQSAPSNAPQGKLAAAAATSVAAMPTSATAPPPAAASNVTASAPVPALPAASDRAKSRADKAGLQQKNPFAQ